MSPSIQPGRRSAALRRDLGPVAWFECLVERSSDGRTSEASVRTVAAELQEICRVDVAASPGPVWAKTSKDGQVFFVRMNNSTRVLPEAEADIYSAEHWV